MENLVIWAPIMGVVALVFAFMLAMRVTKSPAGTDKMQEISDAINEGAMAFRFREYRILAAFVVAMFFIVCMFIDFAKTIFREV